MDEKNQLAVIWQDACQRYSSTTGVDLQTDSAVIHATSADDLMSMLDAQQAQFSKFRERKAALWKVLGQTAQGVEFIADIAKEGIAEAFPPSVVIFAAVSHLVKAAKNVGAAYDSIIKLLEVLKVFITRLNLHTKHQILPELRDIFVRKLGCLLVILGISAKMIHEGRALRFVKNIFQGSDANEIQSQIDEMETLSKYEADLIRTLSLTSLYEQSATLTAVATDVSANNAMLQELITQSQKNYDEDIEDQLQALRGHLNPELSIQRDFDNISQALLPGSGDWLLSHKSFLEWLSVDGGSSCLWLSGGPGYGKTYLAARIIKHLQELYPQGVGETSNTSVAYFLCRGSNERTQMFSVIMRSLADQLARNDHIYLAYLMNALKGDISSIAGTARAWDVMFGNFFSGTDNESRACIVIDGLDEAIREGFEGVEQFLQIFRLFLLSQRNSSTRLKVLLVGRPVLDDMIDDTLGFHATMIGLSGSHELDVVRYVKNQLKQARNLRRVSPGFREAMVQKLSGRTFLWVKLVCKEIASKTRESQMRAALDAFPKDLSASIQHVLESFSETNADDIADLNELLVWAACARRPFTLGELDIIMTMNSPRHEPILDLERLLRKRYSTFFTLAREDGLGTVDLQNKARGLSLSGVSPVDTSQEGENDPGEDIEEDLDIDVFDSPKDTTVHISHLVFLEYFRSQSAKITAVGVDFAKAEIHLLIWCLSLMSDEDMYEGDDWDNDILLMEYACQHWMHHLVAADPDAASGEEKRDVAVRLHRLFTHKETYEGWVDNVNTSLVSLTQVFLETTDTTDAIIRWTSDVDEPEVRCWAESIRGDLKKLLFVIPEVFGAKWLRSGFWDSFLVIYAYVAKFELYPASSPLSSGAASRLFNAANRIACEDILTVANWIGDKDPGYTAQVALLFIHREDYEHAQDWYHKSTEMTPQLYRAAYALAQIYGTEKQYLKAAEWGGRALEIGRTLSITKSKVGSLRNLDELARQVTGWISEADVNEAQSGGVDTENIGS